MSIAELTRLVEEDHHFLPHAQESIHQSTQETEREADEEQGSDPRR